MKFRPLSVRFHSRLVWGWHFRSSQVDSGGKTTLFHFWMILGTCNLLKKLPNFNQKILPYLTDINCGFPCLIWTIQAM